MKDSKGWHAAVHGVTKCHPLHGAAQNRSFGGGGQDFQGRPRLGHRVEAGRLAKLLDVEGLVQVC